MAREVIRTAQELTTAEDAAWRSLVAGDPALASPYFHPDFFHAVAGQCRTARVVINEIAGAPVGFLPLHVTAARIAQPIGGLLSDLHGVIGQGDAAAMVAATGTACLPMRHVFGASSVAAQRHAFHIIDLRDGFAAWEDDRRSFAKSAFRAIRTRADKASKAHGSVRFKFDEAAPQALAMLVTWKRAQYAETRQPDVLARPWVQGLLRHLLDAGPDAGVRAQISTLSFGGKLAAVHLGLRTAKILHYWFPAYDPEFAELSPGNILLRRMVEAAAAQGCQAVHLGAGEVRYKLEFANLALPVAARTVFASSLSGRAAATAGRVLAGVTRALPERLREHPVKLLRRLDRELSLRAA